MQDLRAFDRAVTRHGDRTAIVAEDGTTYSYAELDRRTDALASALDERVGGARTASLLHNGPAAVEMMLAAQKRGQANAQLSFRGSAGELRRMIESAEAEALVFDAAHAEMARAVLDESDLEAALSVGAADSAPERPAVDRYGRVVERDVDYDATEDPDAETAILYTSGTTRRPKATLQDQRRAWLGASQVVMEHGLEPNDVALVTTPWYHDVTTVAWIYPHLQVGATLVLQSSFDPPETLALLDEREVTGLLAVPAQLDALIEAKNGGSSDLSALSYIRTGGAVVSPSLVERTREHLTEGVYNTYGLTEGIANLAHAYPDQQLDNPGTVGHASFNWELRVVEAVGPDETPDPSATVDRGESGELLGRGPCVDGYLDSPEAEAKLFVGDGEWLRTMDVARVDEDGGLHIVDRVDNMLLSGGENVYPQEVELALEDHPDVRAAAVVGVPDDDWGERVAAVVVGEGLTAEVLDRHCKDHDDVANFKRPRSYAVTSDDLPRTDTGTLKRTEIRDRFFGDP
ncbi:MULTISPECIES: class I adenylate-forming enzyme family protein [Halorussus]|uniref:class I adenylate-forming enzyme family protein n=1 Tax=Halorussus TaxID=1070314 RepID=UPI0020A208A3|nr:AMP-binding protein [Halorussus vallis]USZ77818.1 AMP-binding protein [Halorussus vallis]